MIVCYSSHAIVFLKVVCPSKSDTLHTISGAAFTIVNKKLLKIFSKAYFEYKIKTKLSSALLQVKKRQGLKGYLCYKTITSLNVSSEGTD